MALAQVVWVGQDSFCIPEHLISPFTVAVRLELKGFFAQKSQVPLGSQHSHLGEELSQQRQEGMPPLYRGPSQPQAPSDQQPHFWTLRKPLCTHGGPSVTQQ